MRPICFILLASLIGLFGVAFLALGMEHEGMTNPCPYTQGTNSMCPMTIIHHAEIWLSLFLATPNQNPTLLSFIILVILVSISYPDRFPNTSSPGVLSLFRFTRGFNPLQLLFSYFIRLFQSGILHPKVF